MVIKTGRLGDPSLPFPMLSFGAVGFEGGGAFVAAVFCGFGGEGLEVFLKLVGLVAFFTGDFFPGAIALEEGGLGVVLKSGVEGGEEAIFGVGIFDGDHEFDSFFEVADHPVGGGDVDLGVAGLVEGEDAGVLEVAVDDGDDAEVFSGFAEGLLEAADAADVEVDFRPRRGRLR